MSGDRSGHRVLRRLMAGGGIALVACLLLAAQPAGAQTPDRGRSAQAGHQRSSSGHPSRQHHQSHPAHPARVVTADRHRAAGAKAAVPQAATRRAETAKLAVHPAGAAAKKTASKKAAAAAKKAVAAGKAAAKKAAAKKAAANKAAANKAAAKKAAAKHAAAQQQAASDSVAHPNRIGLSVIELHQQQAAAPVVSKPASAPKTDTPAAELDAVSSPLRRAQSPAAGTSAGQSQPGGAARQYPPAATQPRRPAPAAASTATAAGPAHHRVDAPASLLALPTRIAEAGLSFGAAPVVLLGLVLAFGMGLMVAGTRRRLFHRGR